MEKTIYCPDCGRRVASHDCKSTNVIVVNCRKCRKQVVYDPTNKEIKTKNIPQRNCSSGMTFR